MVMPASLYSQICKRVSFDVTFQRQLYSNSLVNKTKLYEETKSEPEGNRLFPILLHIVSLRDPLRQLLLPASPEQKPLLSRQDT